MDMIAVARLVRKRFGRECRVHPMLVRHIPHRLAVYQVIVGSPQRGRMSNAQFVLRMPDLSVILLDTNPLGFQGLDHVVNNILGECHAYAGVIQALLAWYEGVTFSPCQVPLRLHCNAKLHPH